MCQQFKNNSNYVSIDDYTIADDEDIAYELTVHDKRYEAVFYQKPLAIDSTKIAERREQRQEGIIFPTGLYRAESYIRSYKYKKSDVHHERRTALFSANRAIFNIYSSNYYLTPSAVFLSARSQ